MVHNFMDGLYYLSSMLKEILNFIGKSFLLLILQNHLWMTHSQVIHKRVEHINCLYKIIWIKYLQRTFQSASLCVITSALQLWHQYAPVVIKFDPSF